MTTKEDKNDYSKGLIYKIKCLDPEIRDIYVGSTLNEVARRRKHKSSCTNTKSTNYNKPAYKFIREHGGWENWKLCPIKLYPCNSRLELRMEEERIIEELEEFTTLNRQRAWCSKETRKKDMHENYKKYYEENKEEIKEKTKKYAKEHIEKTREYKKKYRDKEEIKEKSKEKYTCDCGTTLIKVKRKRHEKTQKHQNYLKNIT